MKEGSGSKIVVISDLHLGQTGADKLGQYSLLSAREPISNRSGGNGNGGWMTAFVTTDE